MNERGKNITVHKSDPPNLLVDRTKSTVKLIIFVLFESEKSGHFLTIYYQFYLQKCATFITIQGIMEEKMNYRFNIVATVTYTIDRVLETMFRFMLSYVNYTKSNFCDIFDPNRTVIITKIIRRRSYEFYNFLSEHVEAIAFLQTDI